VWQERSLPGTPSLFLTGCTFCRSFVRTVKPFSRMCATHFLQQLHVGLLKTVTVGKPFAEASVVCACVCD
jgi:hypothetical protein